MCAEEKLENVRVQFLEGQLYRGCRIELGDEIDLWKASSYLDDSLCQQMDRPNVVLNSLSVEVKVRDPEFLVAEYLAY